LAGCKLAVKLRERPRRSGPAGGHDQSPGLLGKENAMATFVILYKFTEQGVRNIKDSPKRTEAAKKAAARAGITIKETLWLQGEYDFIAIVEAPDELAATAFNINILKLGNVRSHTMRAFTAEEITKILAHVD
jgi:uncharacterized protein with GYD domain